MIRNIKYNIFDESFISKMFMYYFLLYKIHSAIITQSQLIPSKIQDISKYRDHSYIESLQSYQYFVS